MTAAALPSRRRAAPAHPEDAIQRAIIRYLRLVLPERDYCVFAIPNGGARSSVEAAILMGTGVLAGVWDIEIAGPRGMCWRIEVKAPDGDLSPAQRAFGDWMTEVGAPHVVAHSVDDVRAALKSWGLRTREAEPRAAIAEHQMPPRAVQDQQAQQGEAI